MTFLTELDRQMNLTLFGEDRLYNASEMLKSMPKTVVDFQGNKVKIAKIYKKLAKKYFFPYHHGNFQKAIDKYEEERNLISKQYTYMPENERIEKQNQLLSKLIFNAPTVIYQGNKHYLIASTSFCPYDGYISLFCYIDNDSLLKFRVIWSNYKTKSRSQIINSQDNNFILEEFVRHHFIKGSDEYYSYNLAPTCLLTREGDGFKNVHYYVTLDYDRIKTHLSL